MIFAVIRLCHITTEWLPLPWARGMIEIISMPMKNNSASLNRYEDFHKIEKAIKSCFILMKYKILLFDQEMQEEEKNAAQSILSATQRIRIRAVNAESNYEFKARKREMFLVKYALQAKIQEIAEFRIKEKEEEKKVGHANAVHQDAGVRKRKPIL